MKIWKFLKKVLFEIENMKNHIPSKLVRLKSTSFYWINLNNIKVYFCNLLRNVRFRDICGIR